MGKEVGITIRETSAGKRYRAEAYDRVMGKRITKTFPTLAAARAWRQRKQVQIANGEVRATGPLSLEVAANDWLDRAKSGIVRNRSGDIYKPSVLRGYEDHLKRYIFPALGHVQLSDVRISHVQALADSLVAQGKAASTVRNTINPLRVIYKDAIRKELVRSSPCDAVALPSGEQARDRIASPGEVEALLASLERDQRPIWATAFYAGLRRGELMALRGTDIADGMITVERSYDHGSRSFVKPKSRKGQRRVPVPQILEPFLIGIAGAEGLAFSATDKPFGTSVLKKARPQWLGAALEPITLHECRHTYASMMIAAGINIGTVSDYMGHASVSVTLDRYRHLMPGSELEAMGLLNEYLGGQA